MSSHHSNRFKELFYEEVYLTESRRCVSHDWKTWITIFNGELDFVVHAVAGGPKEGELSGEVYRCFFRWFCQFDGVLVFIL